jgi:hypothetical protein
VLSVHDSYLIYYTCVAELEGVMEVASERARGVALPTPNQFFGLDEVDPEAEFFKDYVAFSQTERSEGYLSCDCDAVTCRPITPCQMSGRRLNCSHWDFTEI